MKTSRAAVVSTNQRKINADARVNNLLATAPIDRLIESYSIHRYVCLGKKSFPCKKK